MAFDNGVEGHHVGNTYLLSIRQGLIQRCCISRADSRIKNSIVEASGLFGASFEDLLGLLEHAISAKALDEANLASILANLQELHKHIIPAQTQGSLSQCTACLGLGGEHVHVRELSLVKAEELLVRLTPGEENATRGWSQGHMALPGQALNLLHRLQIFLLKSLQENGFEHMRQAKAGATQGLKEVWHTAAFSSQASELLQKLLPGLEEGFCWLPSGRDIWKPGQGGLQVVGPQGSLDCKDGDGMWQLGTFLAVLAFQLCKERLEGHAKTESHVAAQELFSEPHVWCLIFEEAAHSSQELHRKPTGKAIQCGAEHTLNGPSWHFL
mmetsp:Transcript_61849/g.109848  ORF Transcript_61849/g.109848 Transcript_61849/m.109848 type:complete len:326 (+) Transcript_61849:1595-2572(+)